MGFLVKGGQFTCIYISFGYPFIMFKLFPPEIKNTSEAHAMVRQKREQMGPVTKKEWVMVVTMLITVALWISGQNIGMASVIAAMMGLSILLLSGVLDWDDCLSEKSAWDILVWFGVLVGMASQLIVHVAALYSAFHGMQLASKVPRLLAALALAYNTNFLVQ
ncbi:hypothetical protein U1Q18_033309 [Sarracenia purpurea var. burkii]